MTGHTQPGKLQRSVTTAGHHMKNFLFISRKSRLALLLENFTVTGILITKAVDLGAEPRILAVVLNGIPVLRIGSCDKIHDAQKGQGAGETFRDHNQSIAE